MKKVKLFVDLGNSQTRVIARAYNHEGATPVQTGFVLDNRFAIIRREQVAVDLISTGNYKVEDSNVLRVDLSDKIKGLKGIFATGLLATDNYQTQLISPTRSGNVPKADNYLVYLALFNALDSTLNWLTKYGNGRSKAELADLAEFELHVLVPPVQKRVASEKFNDVLGAGVSYYSYLTGENVKINISDITVYEEGLMAYWAYLISMGTLQPRPEYLGLTQSRVIILDIGEGTTDVLAVDKNKLLEGVKQTIQTGSNNVIQRTRNAVNASRGLTLTNDMFKDVMVNPVVSVGAEKIDVAEDLEASVGEVADILIGDVVNYLANANVDLSSFDKLMVVGGGALSNGITPSISEFLLDGLQGYVPSIELVSSEHLSEPTLSGLGIDAVSQRNLNLLGCVTRNAVESAKA